MTRHTVHVRPDEAAVARDAAAALVQRIQDRQRAGGSAHVVVTGGGVGTMVLAALVAADIDWSAIDLWWGDERFLPEGHPSIFRLGRDVYLWGTIGAAGSVVYIYLSILVLNRIWAGA